MTTTAIRIPGESALDPSALLLVEDSLLRVVRTVFRATPPGRTQIDKAGYVTLSSLCRSGAVRLSDLAAHLELDLSTVSRQVKILEGVGMVARTADPDDRRAAVVDLTPLGRSELEQQRDWRFQTLDRAFGLLSLRDRDRLVDLLDKLASNLIAESTCSTTTGKATR